MEQSMIQVLDRISKMEEKLSEKMDRQTEIIEGKIDSCQDQISTLRTQNEVQESRLQSVEKIVENHEKTLFNGNNDGLVSQFASLKTKIAMILGFGSVGGGAIASLITSAVNELFSQPH